MPVLLHERASVGYLQGCILELGPAMPPAQFHISHPGGTFICFARALVFEGGALVYDPTTNQAKWVPMRGMEADLSPAEERSAFALCNLVPCDEEAEETMDRFGERRDMGDAAGGGTEEDPSQETSHAEASRKDEMEMDEESGDQGGDVVTHTEVEADDEDK